ncbi:MAG TPA: hypothetical protein VE377_16695 [Candidatus Dormibacteraeota bacterium]|nr:hypothetical protein [Candidatus Dormibacteraeota bacterium]
MHANPPPNPDKSGLEKTADFVNYVLALATGALVFSAELIKKDYPMTPLARNLVLASWFLLSLSVVGGMLAYMRIPVMLSDSNYDLEDKFLTPPGKVQQIAFFVGIIVLGVALGTLLWNRDVSASETNKQGSTDGRLPSPDHYVLGKSAKVFSSKGSVHYHTLLLNESTGEMWEMVCATNATVQFRKIAVEGLPRRPEAQKK